MCTAGGKQGWSVRIDVREKVIGTLLEKGSPPQTYKTVLWSKKWRMKAISGAMRRHRFEEIFKYLRFDTKRHDATRSERLKADKFALTTEIWEPFRENCTQCYNPNENVTVEEQL